MNFFRVFQAATLIALVSVAGGCAQHSTKLTPPALAAQHIHLKDPIAFNSTYAGSVREFRLAAGDYHPIGEDREGAYYKGPPRCFREVWTKTSWAISDSMLNQGTFADCGIFVPKNAALPAKGFLSPRTQTAYLPPDQMAMENARQAASLNQVSTTRAAQR